MKKLWPWIGLIGGITFILSMWFSTPKINRFFYSDPPATVVEQGKTVAIGQDSLGVVGDTFGSINSLFSGLAFLCLIVTIVLQKQELKQNTAELAGSKEALNQQVYLMALQTKAATIPDLLKEIRDAISNADPDYGAYLYSAEGLRVVREKMERSETNFRRYSQENRSEENKHKLREEAAKWQVLGRKAEDAIILMDELQRTYLELNGVLSATKAQQQDSKAT